MSLWCRSEYKLGPDLQGQRDIFESIKEIRESHFFSLEGALGQGRV